MPWIRITVNQIAGHQQNDVLQVPEDQYEHLIRNQWAIAVDPPESSLDALKAERAVLAASRARSAPQTPSPARSEGDEPATTRAEPAGKRPSTIDSKEMWIQWAVENGRDEDSARAMTKADLVSLYGKKT